MAHFNTRQARRAAGSPIEGCETAALLLPYDLRQVVEDISFTEVWDLAAIARASCRRSSSMAKVTITLFMRGV